ncbi:MULTISPECIES: MotA/TolQ/ExbB proton channel family protein [Dyadobacter]|jgi:biopolymer transport protein ExbB|uniref:Outer membrane transport energization protein ExbB n=2 Tax=Dyadobacter TaxID=120831 RepID=A0A2P8GEH8_9BACT|nr:MULTISPECIES: MotA/TolQ/ExbB proton channel family protein [Dyadobacter]MBZ1358339.1 MotA/TolQ/ExbB proton channel family protein [Dyadobacter fermentans]MDR6802983.1 biopolymer transport protein ExbB [Dyadobacter fermentans]MDR7040725.1 biopolymer transport protein ExbB [Dyadobacter sp. BE242]MDR7195127.1 biopolymer transport protein ExbB [Dyadobacter sp. BE34]MDR7214328.1 biopolymer transport protein ExbB [Dyadobacter sp. BE31]
MEKKATSPAPAPKPAAAATKGKGGLNPALVIPLLFAIALCVYIFVLGAPEHFKDGDHEKGPIDGDYYGIVYKGGPIVPILMTCFLVVLTFTIERLITLSKASGTGSIDSFVRKVRSLLDKNQIEEAIKECDKQKGSVGNVIKAGLLKYKQLTTETALDKEQKLAALQKEIEEATTLELPMLQKNLTIIATLAGASTLLALLGTVIGMIKAFAALGTSGSPDSAALATGISEALINTALGIGTSAIATISYAYLNSRVDDLTYSIDEIGMSLQSNFAAHY